MPDTPSSPAIQMKNRIIKALGGEGILVEKDLEDFTEAKRLLLAAFKTGRELTVPQMREITGQDQADRRMREIRSEIRSQGCTIERIHQGGRTWAYKLKTMEPAQQTLL